MKPFAVQARETEGVVVLRVEGHLNAERVKEVLAAAQGFLQQKKVRLVVDLSDCPLVDSPGVASLTDLALKVIDDFKGSFVLTGLDDLKRSVFRMIGLLPTVVEVSTLVEAIRRAREAVPGNR